MKTNTKVWITKQTSNTPGSESDMRLPIGYYAMGTLIEDVQIDKAIWIDREKNSTTVDIRYGIFNTSPVKGIEKQSDTKYLITTRNSVYLLEILEK